MEKGIWKERVGEDASVKNLGPRHRTKGGVYTKKGEGILTIKRRKKESTDICGRLLSRGSECLSDHPRWMFKKNSMEFFVGLQSYLYYCYSGYTLKSHDHLLFPECSMVT